jgi:hypothetical protein
MECNITLELDIHLPLSKLLLVLIKDSSFQSDKKDPFSYGKLLKKFSNLKESLTKSKHNKPLLYFILYS